VGSRAPRATAPAGGRCRAPRARPRVAAAGELASSRGGGRAQTKREGVEARANKKEREGVRRGGARAGARSWVDGGEQGR